MLNPVAHTLLAAARAPVEAANRRLCLAGGEAVLRPADFPWVAPLEAQWPSMRAELDVLLEERGRIPNFQDIAPRQRFLTEDDRWKTFFLYNGGHRIDRNCARCPDSAALVETIPDMTTAMFSILAPGKHLRPHRGIYNGVLRYHLGLKVPAARTRCRIRVDGRMLHWAEGESLIFDDTFEHEVWNDTDETRVVLFVSFLRPLPGPLHRINRAAVRAIDASPVAMAPMRPLMGV